MNNENRKSIEVEFKVDKRGKKIFLKLFFDPDEIWLDTNAIPQSALLCACHDGQSIIISKCGDDKSKLKERYFLNIKWCINEWRASNEIVEALKGLKKRILKDFPNLKEEHKNI